MPYGDLRSQFSSKYKGDIKDPILNILLDTIEAFQNDVQEKLLLSTYTSWSDSISDGMFEVLRRNLFGQMFPGPVFTVAQAALRDVKTAEPVLLEKYHHFSLQDAEGNKNLFTPQKPVWIVPAFTNDVIIDSRDGDLFLELNILPDSIADNENAYLSIYAENVDPLLLERMRCRIAKMSGYSENLMQKSSVLRTPYPATFGIYNDFFQTPYQSRILSIPFSLIKSLSYQQTTNSKISIKFQDLGKYAKSLEKKLTLNAFLLWNMVERETLIPEQSDNFIYELPELRSDTHETLISSVYDIGLDPPVEYINSSYLMDPGYPYQFTTNANKQKDVTQIALTPQPVGDLKVHYYQYDLSDLCANISAGKPFTLYKGLDERIRSLQSIVPTSRFESLNDKKQIWQYFRSLISSRTRWLTKDDLRAAIRSYTPISTNSGMFLFDKIFFDEKVGRVKGFITPYTEIVIPLKDSELMSRIDKPFFERELGLYLKNRTVNGNYLQVKFVAYNGD
jgi:hypothetical protein